MHMLAYCLIGDYWWVSVLRPRLLKIQVRSKAEIKQPFPPLLISKKHKKANFICILVFGRYLWIFVHQNGNGNAFTSLRAAYEDTNSNATSCLIISQHFHNQRAVFYGSPDGSGRRSPTTQRIHRTYGGAPAISCASASRAPKRYTTSPALWRAQCSLDLCSTFAWPSLSKTATIWYHLGMFSGFFWWNNKTKAFELAISKQTLVLETCRYFLSNACQDVVIRGLVLNGYYRKNLFGIIIQPC